MRYGKRQRIVSGVQRFKWSIKAYHNPVMPSCSKASILRIRSTYLVLLPISEHKWNSDGMCQTWCLARVSYYTSPLPCVAWKPMSCGQNSCRGQEKATLGWDFVSWSATEEQACSFYQIHSLGCQSITGSCHRHITLTKFWGLVKGNISTVTL